MTILGSEGVERPCGRLLVRKRPSKGVSITPEDELGQITKRESLPFATWRGDSVGQNRDGRFPMPGKDKGKRETLEYLAKYYVDIKTVSLD